MPVQDSSQAGQIDQPIDETVDVPEQTTDEVSAGEEQQPEQTFTRAQVEAMLVEFEKKVDSRIQSQVAKSENRTTQRIQDRLAALDVNRAALNLTDEQFEKAQDAIIAEEQKNAFKPQSPKGNETPQTAPSLEDAERFMINQVDKIFARHNVVVTPDMDEYKIIQEAWNNPKGSYEDTLLAVDDAARKASARLKALKGNAQARTGVGGGSNAKSSSYDPNKPASYYLEQAAKESKT